MKRRPPNRRSKADQLPGELREAIAQLWHSGRYSVTDIEAHLKSLADGRRSMLPPELQIDVAVDPDALPSRSGLHRHLQGLDRVADKLQRSRAVAEALVAKLEKTPESRVERLNIELMHSVVLDLLMAAGDGEAGADGETGEAQPVTLNPMGVMLVSKALKDLVSAKKADAEHTLKLRGAILKEVDAKLSAAEKQAAAAGEKGLSAERIAQLRQVLAGGAA